MGLEGCPLGRRAQAGLHLESFLVWIARNPLKSPESDEEIQENPSPFFWSGLVWICFGLEKFGLRRTADLVGRSRARHMRHLEFVARLFTAAAASLVENPLAVRG